jgi:hypothetical protein
VSHKLKIVRSLRLIPPNALREVKPGRLPIATEMLDMKILIDENIGTFHAEHRNALVTICIGDKYWTRWKEICQDNWESYCKKVHLDLIVIRHSLDNSHRGKERSPAWQKLLVLSQPWATLYDRIVWVDSDIFITPWAPDIVSTVPNPAMVGISEEGSQLSEAERQIYFERSYKISVDPSKAIQAWKFHQAAQFEGAGILDENVPMFNTGVLVLDPRAHNDLFLEVYGKDSESRLYEQPHLSLELYKRNLVHRLSSRFNWSVHHFLILLGKSGLDSNNINREIALIEDIMKNELAKSYFLHFCGSVNFMDLLNKLNILRA